MKRIPLPRRVLLLVSVIVAILVLGVGIGVGLAIGTHIVSASAHRSPSASTLIVIAFRKDYQATAIDLPPPGLSQGDERVGWVPLYNEQGTQQVGRADYFLSVTDTAFNNTSVIAFKIQYYFSLPGGTVEAGGISLRPSLTSPPVDDLYAVTGGTGSYQGAKGQVHVQLNTAVAATISYTFSFI